jgi:3-phenylpropionate/cinnamic acid dioxygenase small subunit
MDAALRELLDRERIRDLVFRYCRAVDRRDFALLATLYHADAIDDHTPYFCGPAAEFIAQLPQIMAVNRITSHQITNTLIAVDGDRAEGEIHTLSYHLMDTAEGPVDFLVGGRYLDHYVRHGEGWQFMRRKIVLDWSAREPTRFDIERARAGGAVLGQPGAEDPSYAYFRLFPRGG